MARRTPKTETPVEAPVAEASGISQVSDEELLKRIQQEFANRPKPAVKRVTISELFQQSVALVASATGRQFRGGIPRISEQSAVKLYELTLMWALNNRDQTSSDILPPEDMGEPVEAGDEGPEPDEVIEASADQSDPTEE